MGDSRSESLLCLWSDCGLSGVLSRDGALDASEFAVASYLIEQAQAGKELPSALPDELMPPNKR